MPGIDDKLIELTNAINASVAALGLTVVYDGAGQQISPIAVPHANLTNGQPRGNFLFAVADAAP